MATSSPDVGSQAAAKPRALEAGTCDPRAYARLVDRFHAEVFSYLRWLSGDASLAEDLTQETSLRAWYPPPDFRAKGSLRAWVYKVALNSYRQHARRRAVDTILLDGDDDCSAACAAATAPLSLERSDLQQAVQAAIRGLPEPYREAIVLHNLQGLSLREVAQALGVPLGTAKSRLASGFARLRCALREWEGEALWRACRPVKPSW